MYHNFILYNLFTAFIINMSTKKQTTKTPKNVEEKEKTYSIPKVTQSDNSRRAYEAAIIRRDRSSSISSLEEPACFSATTSSSTPSLKTPQKRHTKTFILNLHDNPPPIPTPTVASKPIANETAAMEEADWFFGTAKRQRHDLTSNNRMNRREQTKAQKEKQIRKIKVGALVRKNLTRYGVGGDRSIVVHDVPTLGLVKRLRNCTGRFLVEFDNKMRLELKYGDFTFLTNTPEKQVLSKGDDGNMTVQKMRETFYGDDEVQLVGVSDSPFMKNRVRRAYGIDKKVEHSKKSDRR
jgi:hypothetical protein